MKRLRGLLLAALTAAGLVAAGDARAEGVTLFRARDLSGPHQTFYDDVPDLRYTQFGSRRASSIAVPHGCVAVLYEFPHYRGRSAVFRDSDNNLANTMVGDNTASSMRVNCRGHYPGWRPPDEPRPVDVPPALPGPPAGWSSHWPSNQGGAMLYRDREARGPSQFFNRDVPDLDRTRFGARMASSVDVSPGCVLTLFSGPFYQGRRTDFRERDNNLRNTAVGEDTVSSLRIRCW